MDFNNSGTMRSPFSPRVRQSITGRRAIGLSAAKKNQSKFIPSAESGDVIYKTPLTTLETFGMPLPVMVTETLTFASAEVSVRLSPCGWCWLVVGRRVLAWPREALAPAPGASPAPAAPPAARELTLPQTDLAHKADLVVLFYEDGAQMPSCIGVSPEGTVRYWPSIGQEGVYVDISAELAGQECDRLGDYTRAGLVLATTTCTVVLLDPTVVDERPTVACRTLRPPSGWLGGLGRRVSLLFFGSMPAHAETKLVGVVVLSDGPFDAAEPHCGHIALVAGGAGGPVLQLWRGADLHEHNLRRALSDALARAYLAPQGDPNAMEVAALDVRASGDSGLHLLVATASVARAPDVRYALAHISVLDATAPRVTSLVPLRSAPRDCGELVPRCLPLGPRALLHTAHYAALVSSTIPNDKVDYIDVKSEGDSILAAELCGGVPLVFSKKHGVLALCTADPMAPTPSVGESPMGSPCPSDMYDGNLSLYEIDPHEVSMVTTDACGKLKTAFLFHLRRDTASSRAIVDSLFPPAPPAPPSPARRAEPPERDVDGALDRTVIRIAREMLDDVPAGDPRWKQRPGGPLTNIALGSSAALQIAAQLRDKQRAFSLFIDFLRAAGLWQRLGLVSRESGGGCVTSHFVLGALAEQLAMAIALRRLQQGSDAQLIDAAVYQVICGENPEVEEEPEVEAALSSGALSPSDACYRRVSRVARVLRRLARAQPAAHSDARAAAAHCSAAVNVLISVLTEVHKVRGQWPCARAPPPLGPRALLPALAALEQAATQCGRNCPDATLRARVYESAATLADLILTEAEPLLLNSHTQHVYEKMRREAIQPFVEAGQTDRAAALAEKFKDYELLIEMCVDADDLERLYTYIDKYADEGIAETAFAWLCDRGGRHTALLLRSLGPRYSSRLSAWLQVSPQRAPLLALHRVATHEHHRAAAALADLADEETDSVGRMVTMASLAKLCLFASDEEPQPEVWRRLSARLSLGAQHAALPRELRAGCSGVLPAAALAQLYVDSTSSALTEYDYKKALDLTDYVEDMERRDDLRLRIWCACIRRDDWSACGVQSPADELQTKMFFRLVELAHVMGGDLELLLPPVEDILTAPELAELVSDPRFHFLIKYGYECVDTTKHSHMDE